ncbi:MAG: TolC family protein [Blastocatellales bacterium]|nr:TolC family protein [Blastocatellales bacterium]
MNNRIVYLLAIIILMALPLSSLAQQQGEGASGEVLTLEEAISLALRDNRHVRNAQLDVGKTEDQAAAARTFRLPKFEFNALATQNLTGLDFTFTKGVLGNYPNVGPIPYRDIKLGTPLRPTAILSGQVTMPLSQQYRLGLNVKQVELSGDIAREQLRSHEQSVVNEVKRTYYAILQTQSALESARQALRFYRELDRVTGDYVAQQVALKAEELDVKTKLAKTETEALTAGNQLATLKEQLNQLMGRDVGAEFRVSPAPELSWMEVDVAAARTRALESRPEIKEARLRVNQAELDKRLKKSEYIPDVSLALVYVSPRNFNDFVPRNFAGIGFQMKWEVFDWGRKKHQLAEKEKAIEQASNNLREAENKVRIEVGAKLRELQQVRQALRVAELKQETARENTRVSINKYKVQAALLSDVLQTQAALADADYQYQQALLAFWTARADYEKAIGADK